jgi:hypothetical protein
MPSVLHATRRPWVTIALSALAACAPPTPELLIAPDPARAGLGGLDGPFGAASLTLRVPVRVRDVREADVLFPGDADAAAAVTDAPVVLFCHGGFVDRARYTWLGAHLATRGYVVIQAEHSFDLALFEWGNGDAALARVRTLAADPDHPLAGLIADDGPLATGGHSLGGVVAARQWLDPEVDAAFLIASLAAPGDDVEGADPRPILSLVGADDGRISPAEVLEGAARFPGPTWVGAVDGLNHYGFTDDASEADLASDGVAGRPVAEARPDALAVIDAFLDHALVRQDPAPFDGVFANVEELAP